MFLKKAVVIALCFLGPSVVPNASAKEKISPRYVPMSTPMQEDELRPDSIKLIAEPCNKGEVGIAMMFKISHGDWRPAGLWCIPLGDMISKGLPFIPPEEEQKDQQPPQ